MNGYATVKDMAKTWDVSERIVQLWCKTEMIDGAIRFRRNRQYRFEAFNEVPQCRMKSGFLPVFVV